MAGPEWKQPSPLDMAIGMRSITEGHSSHLIYLLVILWSRFCQLGGLQDGHGGTRRSRLRAGPDRHRMGRGCRCAEWTCARGHRRRRGCMWRGVAGGSSCEHLLYKVLAATYVDVGGVGAGFGKGFDLLGLSGLLL